MSKWFGDATGRLARGADKSKIAAAQGSYSGVESNADSSVRRMCGFNLVLLLHRAIMALSAICAPGLLAALHAESIEEVIRRSATLNDQGEFRESLKLLAPVLQSQGENSEASLGKGWNVFGLALQSTDDQDGARRSYERAIEILGKAPAQKVNLAAALDNLGSLKAEMGQMDESNSLRIKSRTLYEDAGDFAGVERTSINLSLIALRQGRLEVARKCLAEATSAEAKLPTPDAGDVAALYEAKALERDANKDPKSALILIDKAIQSWVVYYGSRYYLLSIGYAMRGRFEMEVNDSEHAILDYEHSLDILRQENHPASRTYFLIEAAYAKALRRFGMKEDAERMEQAAQSGLNSIRNPCPGCTFSANSVR